MHEKLDNSTLFSQFSHGLKIETSPEQYDAFMAIISNQALSVSLVQLMRLFDNDVDKIARCAAYAFSKSSITTEQFSSLLELRTIIKEGTFYECIDFFDENQKLTPKSQRFLANFLSKDELEVFVDLLKSKPSSEHYFYSITLDISAQNNQRLKQLLKFARFHRLIHFEDEKLDIANNIVINGFSAGARDALLKTFYGEHTKEEFPLPGTISINEIDAFVHRRIRPMAVSYPGIANPSSFHGIEASVYYLTLHDQIHRVLMSSIPNHTFYSFLHAIDVVRKLTGMQWSKEIWHSLDMDFIRYPHMSKEERDKKSPEFICNELLQILSQGISSEENRAIGLFTPFGSNDTMWLLMIHFCFNREEWKNQFSIDPALFNPKSEYMDYYRFVLKHQGELIGKTLTEQIVYIKSAWLQQPIPQGKAEFKKDSERFIQIALDGELMPPLKKDVLKQRSSSSFFKNVVSGNYIKDQFEEKYSFKL
ncbi:hypothetical protein [Legionella cincinnatiensis]|uniref:Uncharacterized protein n=1 Tax=Legionella cincinnatiensis TaxID=28085 RepID=A0A378IFB5_9GAMM|nr:hypothetical protein [Legionella cincinnatiensis]KTC92244.1 hypothetical protein Lcin_1023 [Legionella cincinnatiensis]STX33452.1 Uncharacterised protein [Legionella cincinnatiensis]